MAHFFKGDVDWYALFACVEGRSTFGISSGGRHYISHKGGGDAKGTVVFVDCIGVDVNKLEKSGMST